jgi:hypothetical protein
MSAHSSGYGCGACRPVGEAPPPLENRPSLPSVAYRRTTFASQRNLLLERAMREPELERLSTHDSDDHTVAALELWAVVADVLELHRERYFNEALIGTATQQRSIERLARLVGYRPRPGVAALAWLAFLLDPGATAYVPAGLAVQSVPGPTADGPPPAPVTFETLAPLTADALWNTVSAHVTGVPGTSALAAGQSRTVLLRGSAPSLAGGLKPNHTVVLWGDTAVEEKTVRALAFEPDRIAVEWSRPIAGTGWTDARRYTRLLSVFGANAPAQMVSVSVSGSTASWSVQPTVFTTATGATTIDLDGAADGVEAGSELLVVPGSGAPQLVTVTGVQAATATVGSLSGPVTRVGFSPALSSGYDPRSLRVYLLAGPSLMFWGGDYKPVVPPAALYVPVFKAPLADGRTGVEVGRRIVAGAWVPGTVLDLETVEPNRAVIVSWYGPAPAGPPSPLRARLTKRPSLPTFDGEGFGHLRLDVAYVDAPDAWPTVTTVSLLGNVVRASHGETVAQALGNGDATVPFQRFALGRAPLTYVPSSTPRGVVSTLRVAVDGVLRAEVPALYGQPATATAYATATEPDGTTTVRFGDGRRMAARPTTGVQNVHARYRVGAGLAGRVPAGRLSTLMHRPAGVASVANPLAAEGGADPEPLGQARSNAPASVRTLGRLVSLRDAEDLALASGLVAKAQAIWLWSGLDRLIHLTVAAPGGDPLSEEVRGLVAGSLDMARDTSHRLRVDDRALVPVTLRASVVIDARAEHPDSVLAAVTGVARQALSFNAVALGRSLGLSDLVAGLATVPLVIGIDVDQFGFAAAAGFTNAELDERGVARAPDGSVEPVQARLRFLAARPGTTAGDVEPAELPYLKTGSDVQIADGGRA